MKPAPNEVAKLIGKALISASNRLRPIRSWNPSLEQTLHQLSCRDSLTPSLVARVIDPYLLDHHSLAVGFFNWASQQPRFSHTSVTYQSLLKSLSISRQSNLVEKFLRQIKAQKIVLDSSVYGSLIASQIIGKKSRSAFAIFNEANELGHEIGHNICNSLLAALASDGHIGSAKRMFDEMCNRDIRVSTFGFGVFIGGFCKVVDLNETLSLLDRIKCGRSELNRSTIALLIVDGLCRVSRISEAFSVLEELRSREYKPDFMAYRVVAEAFKLAGQPIEAENVLKKKRKLGVAPRAKEYREFIFALISGRQIQQAKDLGEVIINGNFPIEDDVLNALIGSVSASDPDSAILFCKFLIEKERFPTILTLSNLSRNLCKNGKINEMLEVFQILTSKDYFSDVDSYNLMISFLCTAGRVKEAYKVLQEMRKKGFSPNVSSFNSLMEACCKEDLLRPAKRLWDEMFASGCHGNLKTYNTLIRKFSETGEVEDAQRLFHHMLEKGVAPDIITYTSLLEGLCREAKIEAACEIFNRSTERDIALSQMILSTLVRSLCREGYFYVASKVIHGLTPDIENHDSHVIFLKSLVNAGEIGMAVEHVQQIKDNASTLQAICNELVASLSSSLRPEPILQLLSLMQEKGLVDKDDAWIGVHNRMLEDFRRGPVK
ncbi:PREDICTED: pentatricopeptide repeat-containing protein At5g14080 [Nelumbo nucifera]|uniref:Pentatricopeptide repeat-containing protein At5g14080 n=1 Tax=Nelumbo nucifera TaxID=4432 RepID=A0A1U8AU78_NELNU|nr:PREDICTED: pentatricopeptide repeat-containing protein At5g14080 [Nelumbo nucifera]